MVEIDSGETRRLDHLGEWQNQQLCIPDTDIYIVGIQRT